MLASVDRHHGLRHTSNYDNTLPASNHSLRPGLAVDTSFSRHRGNAPQQVYPQVTVPHQPGTTGPTFVSSANIKALKSDGTAKAKKKRGFKIQLGSAARMRPGPQKSIDEDSISKTRPRQSAIGPVYETLPPYTEGNAVKQAGTNRPTLFKLQDAPKPKRFNGLQRPVPLNLGTQISPSDRSIPIGIALPSATILQHKYSLESAATHPQTSPKSRSWSRHDLNTPSIVITPAEDDFEFGLKSSTYRLSTSDGYRPRSSVYSRYSDGVLKGTQVENTPPVPPLPSFAASNSSGFSRNDEVHSFQPGFTDFSPEYLLSGESENATPSIENDHVTPLRSARSLGRMSSQANLPTPRRSRGWWNVLLSPLTASATGQTFSFRSPAAIEEDDEENEPIFANASMISGSGRSIRTDESQGLHSAPLVESDVEKFSLGLKARPKRSDTAPGALDLGSLDAVNIYRIPSCGAASSYYDPNRHFPSLIGPIYVAEEERGCEAGWSPSQSVNRESRAPLPIRLDAKKPALGEAASYYNGEITLPGSSVREVSGMPMAGTHSSPGDISQLSPTPVVENAHTARVIQWPLPEDLSKTPQPAPEPPVLTTSGRGLPSRPGSNFGVLPLNDSREKLIPSAKCDSQFQKGYVSEKYLEGGLKDEQKPRRHCIPRYAWMIGTIGTSILIAVAVALIILLPLRQTEVPVEAQWLDLTGFPPLPTGVTTVVGPRQMRNVDGCVSPNSLWTCSAPPGEAMSTIRLDQPNLRLLIRFRNGTLSNETALEPSTNTTSRRNHPPFVYASDNLKRSLFHNGFDPSPAPPTKQDQIFLGRTTEKNSQPFNGEETPFFISLLDPVPLQQAQYSRIKKRNDGFHYPYPRPPQSHSSGHANSDSVSNFQSPGVSPSAEEVVPPPVLRADHRPVPAEIYPLVSSQPLRLFNRGQEDEYYGFYTYFDRTIFIAESTNSSSNTSVSDIASSNVPLESTSAVCTWSETRLFVQIWTEKRMVNGLRSQTNAASIPAVNSTANEMTSPGSFPYSVTITLDRHGGDPNKKGLYCYELDEERRVVGSSGGWIAENRKFGGTVINPGPVPGTHNTGMDKRGDEGSGIDGGTAGCSCSWQN